MGASKRVVAEGVAVLQGLIAEVLAAWREAERVAAEHQHGWAHDRAVVAAARLRDLYQELTGDPEAADPDAVRDALGRLRVGGAGGRPR